MTRIAPSILSADFAALGTELRAIDAAGADWIHVDIMDGHFVPNLTIGPAVVEALRPHTEKYFDCHLMVSPVEPFVAPFIDAGADGITVHAEQGPHLDRVLTDIRSRGAKAGVSLNPATSLDCLTWALDNVDLVLLMSVNPGFGGQSFIEYIVDKVGQLSEMREDRNFLIEVDGGVNAENAPLLVDAGADVLVAGSSVFSGGPTKYEENIAALR